MTAPFTYSDVPIANHDPSDDQPLMQVNFQSISGFLGIDHATFNTNPDVNQGMHNKITYAAPISPTPPVPTDPISIAFTKNDSGGHPNNYFINSQGTFPMTCIKSFASFTTGPGASLINSINVASFSSPSSNVYQITLNSNAVFGNNICIFFNTTQSGAASNIISYSFANPVLTVTANISRVVNFVILQA